MISYPILSAQVIQKKLELPSPMDQAFLFHSNALDTVFAQPIQVDTPYESVPNMTGKFISAYNVAVK